MKTWTIVLSTLAIIVVGLVVILSHRNIGQDSQNYQSNCMTPAYNLIHTEKIDLKNCIAIENYTANFSGNNWTHIQEIKTPLPEKPSDQCPAWLMGSAYCDDSQCVIITNGVCELRKYCPNGYETYNIYNDSIKYIEDGYRCS